MITAKELKFVDAWASKTPMPGEIYSKETLEYISKCVKTFKEKYKDKEYNIIFSNGDEINLEIQEKNLCHLLGIDYTNIRNDFFNHYRQKAFGISSNDFTSYQLLELIIENIDKVVELDNDPNNKAKAINYYKSRIKCEIFDKLCDFSSFNYGAINFQDSDKKGQYGLFVPSNEPVCPYFMMTIKPNEEAEKSENESIYIPTSALAPKYPKKIFENHEVIIPTQMLISDAEKLTKLVASPSEKIKLLTLYQSIINEYNLPNKLNIYQDYEVLLNELSRKNKK